MSWAFKSIYETNVDNPYHGNNSARRCFNVSKEQHIQTKHLVHLKKNKMLLSVMLLHFGVFHNSTLLLTLMSLWGSAAKSLQGSSQGCAPRGQGGRDTQARVSMTWLALRTIGKQKAAAETLQQAAAKQPLPPHLFPIEGKLFLQVSRLSLLPSTCPTLAQ